MTSDALFTDAALRSWKQHTDRVQAFFDELSDEQLEQAVAPGRNRLLYLLGHLAAVSDAMLPLLGIGERLHPELDAPFLKNADRAVPSSLSAGQLRTVAHEVDEAVWTAFNRLTPEQWLERHMSISADDFGREPHRNRYSVLLSRTAHLSFHYGQMVLTRARE